MLNSYKNLESKSMQPTDQELKVIEIELKDIDLKKDFETEVKSVTFTDDELKIKIKNLTKKELECIDEMVRIIEDPSYISNVRKRRLENQDEDSEVEVVSFGDSDAMFNEYSLYQNED